VHHAERAEEGTDAEPGAGAEQTGEHGEIDERFPCQQQRVGGIRRHGGGKRGGELRHRERSPAGTSVASSDGCAHYDATIPLVNTAEIRGSRGGRANVVPAAPGELSAFVEPGFVDCRDHQRAVRRFAYVQPPAAPGGQIMLQTEAFFIGQRDQAAHDFDEAGLLGQIVNFDQTRQALGVAQDIANDIERLDRRVVPYVIDLR
jgi:hypothetical protein